MWTNCAARMPSRPSRRCNRYSIISPEIEEAVLPYTQARGIGVIVYSPMKSGLLSGAMTRERVAAMPADDFRRRTPNF